MSNQKFRTTVLKVSVHPECENQVLRMSERPLFKTRTFRLVGHEQIGLLSAVVRNLPVDAVKPLEVIIREEKRARKIDQNALMWAGPLRDIAEQAWVHGKQFSPEIWHEHIKRECLPDETDSFSFDPSHVKDGYRKWDCTPKGARVLIGSTTQLTVNGMAHYLEQVYACGASLGVQFGVRAE